MSIGKKIRRELSSLHSSLLFRLSFDDSSTQAITDRFHRLYFDSRLRGKTWMNTSWMGVPVRKCPMDLWTYQELIHELTPDVIIETGTQLGGSAYYFAQLCDLVGKGRVITIDIDTLEESVRKEGRAIPGARPEHGRIEYLHGSSTAPDILGQVIARIRPKDQVVVILDSDHQKDHVLKELHAYAALVTDQSYLIVEDTNLNGHPIQPDFGPGPMEAVEQFLQEHTEFVVDRSRENHLITFHPRGYLKKVGRRE